MSFMSCKMSLNYPEMADVNDIMKNGFAKNCYFDHIDFTKFTQHLVSTNLDLTYV